MKIYLSGPIMGRTDEDCRQWREEVVKVSKRRFPDFSFLDPLRHDYRDLDPSHANRIVESDKRDIQECDALLVHYDRPSVGTSMEIHFAWALHKIIVLADYSGKPLSPWLLYHTSVIVPDVFAGLDWLAYDD